MAYNQIEYQNNYNAKNYDRITISVKKGKKEQLKKILGYRSISNFLNEVIDEKLKEGVNNG